jgi:hypothetical protein
MPGPLVAVNERAPIQPAPITMPIAASSSSACRIATRASLSVPWDRNRRANPWKASIIEVDGVIGYHAATVAPA